MKKINHSADAVRFAALFFIAAMMIGPECRAQMQDPEHWVNYEQVLGVKTHQRHYDYQVIITQSNVPANVLWPGEQPQYTLDIVNKAAGVLDVDGHIDVIQIGARSRENDIWTPELVKLNQLAAIPLKVHVEEGGHATMTLSVRLPETFGDYALVLDLGQYGRQLVTSVARTFAAAPERTQFPKQSLDDIGPAKLQRLGIQAIRMGVDYVPTTHPDYRKRMEELDKQLKEYQRKNITVLLMFGAGPTPMPLGTPRSFLDSSGKMLNTKQDYVWLPSQDEDFSVFVRELCSKYGWPRGPVTAVSLWNEPWEGISISGWQSDMLRYREIYRKMAEAVLAARQGGAQVLVGGGDSGSNAWDKLFADGKMDFLPIFDFCSIHYQGMESPSIYPQWIGRRSGTGRVKIWDTESWVANTDDRIGLVIAVNRSAGYDRNMGIYAGYLFTGEGHAVPEAWPQAAALGAAQHFIGDREFDRLLFPQGLPWVMLFKGREGHRQDETMVVSGDIGAAFGKSNVLYRGVKLRAGARMILRARPGFALYDFYGNEIPAVDGKLILPLGSSAYYLRVREGGGADFDVLTKAVESARIEGYDPVEIIAKDFTERIATKPALELQVSNILNRTVKGKLDIKLGALRVDYPRELVLQPHEMRMVSVRVLAGKETEDNAYPLNVRFDGGQGLEAEHEETMHVNTISHRTVRVDGQLDDWAGVLPQVVSANGESNVSITEAAWYPFRNFGQSAKGFANGYLAYDSNYFYFACKTADHTPSQGTYRFTQRPDDTFFYPDTAWRSNPETSLQEVEDSALSGSGWKHYWQSAPTTRSYGLELKLPEGRESKVSFYLPNRDVWKAVVDIYDVATGDLLASHECDDLWDGVYESFRVSGHVRVVIRAVDWWYTVKLGGIFIDEAPGAGGPAGTAATFLAEDADTKEEWKSHYGSGGYWLAGQPMQLPAATRCAFLHTDDKEELVWPQGVRHFTYRKDPVLPDNSGLGYSFDNVMIAFNAIPLEKDELLPNPPGTMPRYTGYKCTDYEYALNQVAAQYGGGTEIWRELRPGMNRKHFFPRQPKSEQEGAVENGKLVVRRDGNTLITECAIPWSEIPDVKKILDSGGKVKFSFRVNDDGVPNGCMELAKERSVSKQNSRAFHPDWQVHWANEVEFGFEQ